MKNYTTVQEIFTSSLKPKETITALVYGLETKTISLDKLFDFYQTAKDPEKASCLAALAEVTLTKPGFVESKLNFIITQVGHKANRINWEASEIIAHVASSFPDHIISAVPALKQNALNGGTVVKWSAAYALTEIAQNSPEQAKKLIPFFTSQADLETNSGVKKIYLKYLSKT